MEEIKFKTPQELDSLDLLELVCELHARNCMHMNEELHTAYLEARRELEQRIIKNCHIPPVMPAVCSCGKYHSKRNLIENKCPHCGKKIIAN